MPQDQWREVENAANAFWQEISETDETAEKLVNIFRDYRKVINSAGVPTLACQGYPRPHPCLTVLHRYRHALPPFT